MGIIGFVTFVMIGSTVGALIVFLVSLSVFVGLLGLIYFWGLYMNSITVLNVIVSIGVSVDYSAHIV